MATLERLIPKARSFNAGSLTAETVLALLKKHVRGKFAQSSTLRSAKRFVEQRVASNRASGDILHHKGRLVLDELSLGRRMRIGLLLVEGDLVVKGRYEDSLDPESVVVVTGSLRAGEVITRGFLEVHGNLVAERSILFLDNDACCEVFGDVRAPFVYTNYHAVKVHGGVKARLVTGDAKHIRSTEKHTFIEETDRRVRDLLSPKLLKVFADELFEDEEGDEEDPDAPWIDAIDSEKLAAFVRRGQPALANTASSGS
ncbi:polymer-forming cytoskeletal protein [Pyxidicoccus fallax]|uniref:Polymer-forming cytoskeletal protein n=1 Tax=Pyxidicoccus fallax TaxID=394095 RepID=A0A848LFA5_9BACT|nr:polymer-forming cytoskeletal protein [Pyxidicoccus fallax]NMO14228.1 polymer-forming cytoskeletal protein [Pyxidicoccus fallax]NPC80380.1 polymer-forming cytoskeletal protein [Pyxidicoccus fallax]